MSKAKKAVAQDVAEGSSARKRLYPPYLKAETIVELKLDF